jgi:ABC-type uncharacterized transport system permease subunit
MYFRSIHRLWRTATLAATGVAGDSPLFVLDYALRVLRVGVLLSLWRVLLGEQGGDAVGANAASGSAASGDAALSLGAVLTYTLVAEAFAEQLSCRTGVDLALWDGSIATRLVRPMGLTAQFAAESVGRWSLGFALFSVPLLVAAPWLGVDPLPASPAAGALFALSLPLAVAVGMALEFVFAALMATFGWSNWEVERWRSVVGKLLSGAIIPLALYPWGLGAIFEWLPFAAMASAPLRIYTGTGPPLLLLLTQVAWALALWALASWLWRVSRERMVVYGG